MLNISFVDDSCAEVESSLITVEDEALACWDTTSERAIARYDLREVLSVQFISPGEGEGRCRRGRTDQAHPNAYRRWTEEDENRIVDFYHRGVSFPEIAAAVGRRVGGVRSRLVHLGVIEPEPGDRISFPGIAFVRERARLLRQPGRPERGADIAAATLAPESPQTVLPTPVGAAPAASVAGEASEANPSSTRPPDAEPMS